MHGGVTPLIINFITCYMRRISSTHLKQIFSLSSVLKPRDYPSDSGFFKARRNWTLGGDRGEFICYGICACER